MSTRHRLHETRGTGLMVMVTVIYFLAFLSISPATTKTWITTSGANDWFNGTNWSGGVPGAADDAVITNAGTYSVMLTGLVTIANITLGGNGAGTRSLVFSNWNSTLNATNVTILTNGTMTLPSAFTNNTISNNIYIVCSNLTVETGGSINANGKGYIGGIGSTAGWTNGFGPGGGGSGSGGGGYGGVGGYTGGGSPYGSSNAPVDPGSGGAAGGSAGNTGGAGGGAIRVTASGTVTVNGTLTANGNAGSGVAASGGSGGGIYITCRTLMGATGTITANGGNGGTSDTGGGGGGRIAVIYNPTEQNLVAVPTILFAVMRGTGGAGHGDIGTLYFPDSQFLTGTIPHIGQWIMPPELTNCSANTLTLSNSWIRFVAEGFHLTVTNDMAIIGSTGRLDLGSTLWTQGPILNVGGNLTLTNGGNLYVYNGITNAANPAYGALVSVTKDMAVASNSWIYVYQNSVKTNGASALFQMRHLTIASNAGFNADQKGYPGVAGANGYGPGGGGQSGSGGGGYGGKGGGSTGGNPYGSSNAPVDLGSAGGSAGSQAGGTGGGAIRIAASGTVTLNGTLTANGENSGNFNGSGSGGGVYITSRTFMGTNGIIRAKGGTAGTSSGGGGGGRIAVWRVSDSTGGAIQTYVDGGSGGAGDGAVGTIVWGWAPPAGTIVSFH